MVNETSIDPVTGVFSRAEMQRRLDEQLARAERAGTPLAVFLFDVDFFKTVNDVFGHLRGDLVLRQLAEVVTGVVGDSGTLFRYGGDEFVLLLPDADRTEAVKLAVHLTDQVKATQFPGDPVLHTSVSLGVACYPDDGVTQAALLTCADRRNYLAKHRGRGGAVADDADTAAEPGSSRLWERDAALTATHEFLTQVAVAKLGALRLTGPPGAGHSRFLEEVRRQAALRGFDVVTLAPEPAPLPVLSGGAVLVLADRDAAARIGEVVAAGPEVLAVVYAAVLSGSAAPPGLPELGTVELSPWSPATMRIWLRSMLQGEPSRTLVSWIARQSGGLPAAAAAELDRLRARDGLLPAGPGGWTINPAMLRRSHRQVRLPAQMTGLVGRDSEQRQVTGLVRDNRLVTLVGVGGIGKTRLSLSVAAQVAGEFDDGVVFVPLDTSTDEDQVIAEIARALQVDEAPGEDLLETVLDHLVEAATLLVLDNFEQVIGAAPLIGQLLAAAPAAKALVTSREPLMLYGEQVYRVPPLPSPDVSALPPGTAGVALARHESPAVALFEQRAKATRTEFALSPETLPAVAALCRRLDGLPLAIELAAAQIDRMDPAGLLDHLGRHLDPLGAGPRNRPERQQTLRGALDWSFALLDDEQREFFAALSVFVGGFAGEAAAAVCGPAQCIDVLARKSLLTVETNDAGQRRYRMLETVRAYATLALVTRYGADPVHRRHAGYYADFAERAAAGMESPDQVRWAEWLECEYPNLRSAISWALDEPDLDSARRICEGLWRYWRQGSHIREGREWLDRVLAAGPGMTDDQRSRLLYPAAVLAATQDDHETAVLLGRQGLRLAEATGDLPGTARAHNVLGAAALAAGQYGAAADHFGRSLATHQQVGEARGTASALGNLAKLSLRIGRIDEAGDYIDRCLELERATGNSGGILLGLECRADVLRAQGRLAAAREVLGESLALSRELGDVFGEAMSLYQLGTVAQAGGDGTEALRHYRAAIGHQHEVGDREGLAISLECVAEVTVEDEPELAVRLLAAADGLRARYRLPIPPDRAPGRAAALARARTLLGDPIFRTAGQAGRAAPLDLVVDQVQDLPGNEG